MAESMFGAKGMVELSPINGELRTLRSESSITFAILSVIIFWRSSGEKDARAYQCSIIGENVGHKALSAKSPPASIWIFWALFGQITVSLSLLLTLSTFPLFWSFIILSNTCVVHWLIKSSTAFCTPFGSVTNISNRSRGQLLVDHSSLLAITNASSTVASTTTGCIVYGEIWPTRLYCTVADYSLCGNTDHLLLVLAIKWHVSKFPQTMLMLRFSRSSPVPKLSDRRGVENPKKLVIF